MIDNERGWIWYEWGRIDTLTKCFVTHLSLFNFVSERYYDGYIEAS